ncbi:Oidioi.mRNA.OKI2018_I69.chr1.g1707.t1.cds [Oikopleura dioica]|uniref:Oidioi.mRNA.OKI2018_I69.chr1.g1707.t1.cds n=1 Tax=Oikopleura dioica TaxID=34765 RepID=A0ABN7SU04_OIKDI|nr:Oidioi.mRNA.OKI2018_I69.chr1.g1707.t1.cds [Oikopleura dioica]
MLYRWNNKKRHFRPVQGFTSHGAASAEYFSYLNQHYLIIANYEDPKRNAHSRYVSSQLFWYDFGIEQFVTKDHIDVRGVLKWSTFIVQKSLYLVGARHKETSIDEFGKMRYTTTSPMFKFDPRTAKFELLENISIPSHGATDILFARIRGRNLLLVGNFGGDLTPTRVGEDVKNVKNQVQSEIYEFHEHNESLSLLQTIETNGLRNWQNFQIGGDYFILAGNSLRPETFHQDNPTSILYKWSGEELFKLSHNIPTRQGEVSDWKYVEIEGKRLLVGANSRHSQDSGFYSFRAVSLFQVCLKLQLRKQHLQLLAKSVNPDCTADDKVKLLDELKKFKSVETFVVEQDCVTHLEYFLLFTQFSETRIGIDYYGFLDHVRLNVESRGTTTLKFENLKAESVDKDEESFISKYTKLTLESFPSSTREALDGEIPDPRERSKARMSGETESKVEYVSRTKIELPKFEKSGLSVSRWINNCLFLLDIEGIYDDKRRIRAILQAVPESKLGTITSLIPYDYLLNDVVEIIESELEISKERARKLLKACQYDEKLDKTLVGFANRILDLASIIYKGRHRDIIKAFANSEFLEKLPSPIKYCEYWNLNEDPEGRDILQNAKIADRILIKMRNKQESNCNVTFADEKADAEPAVSLEDKVNEIAKSLNALQTNDRRGRQPYRGPHQRNRSYSNGRHRGTVVTRTDTVVEAGTTVFTVEARTAVTIVEAETADINAGVRIVSTNDEAKNVVSKILARKDDSCPEEEATPRMVNDDKGRSMESALVVADMVT